MAFISAYKSKDQIRWECIALFSSCIRLLLLSFTDSHMECMDYTETSSVETQEEEEEADRLPDKRRKKRKEYPGFVALGNQFKNLFE